MIVRRACVLGLLALAACWDRVGLIPQAPAGAVLGTAVSIENKTGRKVAFWLRPEDGDWTIKTLEASMGEEYNGRGGNFHLQVIGQTDKTVWRLTPTERWALTWNGNRSAIVVKKIVQDD